MSFMTKAAEPKIARKTYSRLAQAQGHVESLFPVTFYRRLWENTKILNKSLKNIIIEKQNTSDGSSASNSGGWHSKPNFHTWPFPEVLTLKDMISEAVDEAMQTTSGIAADRFTVHYDQGCWANINRDRDYNNLHNHAGASWSGVYYVDMGEPETGRPNNGFIEFIDPRPMGGSPKKLRFLPKAGEMLLFPSWLDHWVHPFYGKGERISIAFNLNLEITR